MPAGAALPWEWGLEGSAAPRSKTLCPGQEGLCRGLGGSVPRAGGVCAPGEGGCALGRGPGPHKGGQGCRQRGPCLGQEGPCAQVRAPANPGPGVRPSPPDRTARSPGGNLGKGGSRDLPSRDGVRSPLCPPPHPGLANGDAAGPACGQWATGGGACGQRDGGGLRQGPGEGAGSAGAPRAMRTLLLLWVALASVGAQLPCPHGGPCPVTPAIPARSAMGCQDSSSCPASCQLPESVPCAGGHHCCPRGSHCSSDGESCVTDLAPRAVPCPDGQSECPDDATCCVTSSGAWGCCPMPQASCCADKVHCCPHATVCDLTHGRCVSPTGDTNIPLSTAFPAWKRQPSTPVALRQVLCPDGHSACPDGETCCQLSPTQYGCCPLQNAVCCSDGQHCCPQGTTCDLVHSTCTSLRGSVPLAALPRAHDVKCDEMTSCPDGNTCCRLSSGAWGCCPLEQAVCCPDLVHCCPQGYTCDPEGGSCLHGGGTRRPWVRKTPALPGGRQVTSGNVICDETTSCPDGSTCCRLSLGTWGCCPLEQAVCCGDHRHCCPRGYTCNVATESCEKLLAPTPLVPTSAAPRQGPSAPHRAPVPLRATGTHSGGLVPCGAAGSCHRGQRCCQARGGSWGCCPFAQGSCCSDGRHCCPAGSRCTRAGWGCSPQRWDLL